MKIQYESGAGQMMEIVEVAQPTERGKREPTATRAGQHRRQKNDGSAE